jgi:hypothetical protein
VVDIIPPSPIDGVVKPDGSMFQRFMNWTQDVTNTLNFVTPTSGAGTPEASIAAKTGKFYTDTAVPNLYWKSVDDVAGDKALGWLLVV